MGFFYLYIVTGWVVASIVAALFMGRFIAAGRGAPSSQAVPIAPECPEGTLEVRTAADVDQDSKKQLAA